MLSERTSTGIAIDAPAKVNLFLEVLAKRPDGYHDLQTLMVTVSLYDRLEFRPAEAGTIVLTCNRPELPCGSDNLVQKAAAALVRFTGFPGGASIHLTKRIPMAAGLAGGSSDAAATLVGLNDLWGLYLPRPELARLAADVGSDVAFFLTGGAAWCEGRGEIVTPLIHGRPLDIVLATPPIGLSTAAVFREVQVPLTPTRGDAIRRAMNQGDLDGIAAGLFNRLQEPAERICPEVADLRRRLATLAPAGCLMTGSGSTVFALARDRADAERIAGLLLQPERDPRNEFSGRPILHIVQSCV
jgi:4-diphosphocytidyl-2-C-methyl-D-erythritol kinase